MTQTPEVPLTESWDVTMRYLNGTASNDLRIVLCGIVDGGHVADTFSMTDLASRIVDLQGPELYWAPDCKRKVISATMPTPLTLNRMAEPLPRGLWQAKPEGREMRLALNGLFGSLSLDYPDTPMSRLLGESQVKQVQTRQPATQYRILRELVDQPRQECQTPHVYRLG